MADEGGKNAGTVWSQELKDLYPFLQTGTGDNPVDMSALRQSIERKAAESVAEHERFFAMHGQAVLDAAVSIAGVYQGGGKMFAMGNGGSSCDAAHFAVEFQHPVTTGRPALPALCLTSDAAILSAVANDVGFEHVFVRQLEAYARKGDGLIGFSTSGNSRNLLSGFRKAKELGLVTIGMTGGDGGQMAAAGLVDTCLVVGTDSIHRVQEVHVTIYHILWDLVHTLLSGSRGKLRGGDEVC